MSQKQKDNVDGFLLVFVRHGDHASTHAGWVIMRIRKLRGIES
jgi:hypothetical protein